MILGRININPALHRLAEVAACEAAIFHAVRDQAADPRVSAWADSEMRRAHEDLSKLRKEVARPRDRVPVVADPLVRNEGVLRAA